MKITTRVRDYVSQVALNVLEKIHGTGTWYNYGYSIPKHYPWNWWQKDLGVGYTDFHAFGPIYACVAIIAQDLARIPIQHLRMTSRGKKEVVTTKAPYRVFRKPNKYQTRSDLMLYMARSLLMDGNFYGTPTRNERTEVEELYPLHPAVVHPYLHQESGEYFYRVSRDPTSDLIEGFEEEFLSPRNVLHVRLQTPRHPLIGETPLVAAVYPTMAGTEINKHTAHFFSNMSRPSGILRHPKSLSDAALDRLKKRAMEVMGRTHTGEPLVVGEGVEWTQLQMTAVDAELAKSYQLTERQIFQIYRVPPFLGGDLEKATFANVESLIRFYVQSCLGFYVDHIEEALTSFFRLPPGEEIKFDLETALLRGDFKERMDALGKGVQNGVYAPNEARARENLPPVENGDEPRVQQQLVPLSFGMNTEASPGSSVPSDQPPPEPEPEESKELESEERAIMFRHQLEQAYVNAGTF